MRNNGPMSDSIAGDIVETVPSALIILDRNDETRTRIGISEGADNAARKLAEETLRDSEQRLNFALQFTHTGAWDLDLVDHTAHRTLEHDRIFGYGSLLPHWTYEIF